MSNIYAGAQTPKLYLGSELISGGSGDIVYEEYAFTGQENYTKYTNYAGAPYFVIPSFNSRFWLPSQLGYIRPKIVGGGGYSYLEDGNYVFTDNTAMDSKHIGLNGTSNADPKLVTFNGNISFMDADYSTAADFKAHLAELYAAGTPVKIQWTAGDPAEGE